MQAGARVKSEGLDNNLCELIVNDPMFMITKEEMDSIMKPELFIGRSAEQFDEFLTELINPILEANKDILNETAEINV